jgi:ATP-dependent exoDNAse (exonuclease V) alpha subunit
LGARSLNLELQRALNPPGEVRVERFGWTYAAGDKVMQVENDYDKEVYNGDLGFIVRIDPEQGEVVVDFEGRAVTYDVGELDAVVPAYATTVHKAQGSEYPAVVIPTPGVGRNRWLGATSRLAPALLAALPPAGNSTSSTGKAVWTAAASHDADG